MKYVDLHVHFDGAIRHSSLHEIALKYIDNDNINNINDGIEELDLILDKSYDHFIKKIVVNSTNLVEFLKPFHLVIKLIKWAVNNIGYDILTKLAFEICEDMYTNDVIYFELRYNPYYFIQQNNIAEQNILSGFKCIDDVQNVYDYINKGLKQGFEKYGIYSNHILCISRRHNGLYAKETVHLAHKNGCGIDVSGSEIPSIDNNIIEAYKCAVELNVPRTCHTEDPKDFENVMLLNVQRIGHGYYIINNEMMLQRIKDNNIHMECCLVAGSYGNGYPEIKLKASKVFNDRGISFSLNTDDPTMKRNCSMKQDFLIYFRNSYDDKVDFEIDYLYYSEQYISITTQSILHSFASDQVKQILLHLIRLD